MVTQENENYLRIILLLMEGGMFILKALLDREIGKSQLNIDQHLLQHRGKLKHKVKAKKQYEKLFPSAGTTSIETWDIDLLAIVIVQLFKPCLSIDERINVKVLHLLRQDVQAHASTASISNEKYIDIKKHLEKATSPMSNGLSASQQIEIRKIISMATKDPLDIQRVNENLQCLVAIDDTLQDIHNKLDNIVKQMSENMENAASGFNALGFTVCQSIGTVKSEIHEAIAAVKQEILPPVKGDITTTKKNSLESGRSKTELEYLGETSTGESAMNLSNNGMQSQQQQTAISGSIGSSNEHFDNESSSQKSILPQTKKTVKLGIKDMQQKTNCPKAAKSVDKQCKYTILVMNACAPTDDKQKISDRQKEFIKYAFPSIVFFPEFPWVKLDMSWRADKILRSYRYMSDETRSIIYNENIFAVEPFSQNIIDDNLGKYIRQDFVFPRRICISKVRSLSAPVIDFLCMSCHGPCYEYIWHQSEYFECIMEFLRRLDTDIKLPILFVGDFDIERYVIESIVTKPFVLRPYTTLMPWKSHAETFLITTEDLILERIGWMDLKEMKDIDSPENIFDHDPLIGHLSGCTLTQPFTFICCTCGQSQKPSKHWTDAFFASYESRTSSLSWNDMRGNVAIFTMEMPLKTLLMTEDIQTGNVETKSIEMIIGRRSFMSKISSNEFSKGKYDNAKLMESTKVPITTQEIPLAIGVSSPTNAKKPPTRPPSATSSLTGHAKTNDSTRNAVISSGKPPTTSMQRNAISSGSASAATTSNEDIKVQGNHSTPTNSVIANAKKNISVQSQQELPSMTLNATSNFARPATKNNNTGMPTEPTISGTQSNFPESKPVEKNVCSTSEACADASAVSSNTPETEQQPKLRRRQRKNRNMKKN